MNYLALVNRSRRECGVSGNDLSSVAGTTGEAKRFTDWVAQAWVEIQEEHNEFDWMRKSFSFATTAEQQAYLPDTDILLSDFGSWATNESFRCYETALGTPNEMFLTLMTYSDFRDTYQFSSFRTTYTRPISIAVRPNDKALLLGPAPGTIYTVVGEYFYTPIELAIDADEPAMPSRYHMAIVYRVMQSYALYEAAPEVLQRGQMGYSEMIKRIESDQLQPVMVGGAMV